MIGLEEVISRRAITPELAKELKRCVEKAAKYYTIMGHGSFAPGNADGGLTTIKKINECLLQKWQFSHFGINQNDNRNHRSIRYGEGQKK